MGRHSRRISMAACLFFMLAGGAAYAMDNYVTNGEDAAALQKPRPAMVYTPVQQEAVKAFTRELAFIKTFAVSAPAQYEQKSSGQGAVGRTAMRSTGGPISEETIGTPELRSSQVRDGDVSASDEKKAKKSKKKFAGRKK